MKTKVYKFFLQSTRSFEYAPQREEYLTDAAFEEDCKKYAEEWRDTYECCKTDCSDRSCPQHFPFS